MYYERGKWLLIALPLSSSHPHLYLKFLSLPFLSSLPHALDFHHLSTSSLLCFISSINVFTFILYFLNICRITYHHSSLLFLLSFLLQIKSMYLTLAHSSFCSHHFSIPQFLTSQVSVYNLVSLTSNVSMHLILTSPLL